MKLYYLIGRVTYVVLYPLIAFFVSKTTRTRIIVRHDNEILVMKGWLSNGEWSLPGGGLGHTEDAVQGALRELHEEVGLQAETSSLQLLYDDVIKYGWYVSFRTVVYECNVSKKPHITPRKLEVKETAWLSIDSAMHTPRLQIVLKKAYPN